MRTNKIILTSAILLSDGAAINTTYGVNSDVRRIFNACGSTSKIAIFPSLWIRRIVSNFVPYIASSWVPIEEKMFTNLIKLRFLILNFQFNETHHIPNIHLQQYQPSCHHAIQNSNCVHFLHLVSLVWLYLYFEIFMLLIRN